MDLSHGHFYKLFKRLKQLLNNVPKNIIYSSESSPTNKKNCIRRESWRITTTIHCIRRESWRITTTIYIYIYIYNNNKTRSVISNYKKFTITKIATKTKQTNNPTHNRNPKHIKCRDIISVIQTTYFRDTNRDGRHCFTDSKTLVYSVNIACKQCSIHKK